MDDQTNYPGGTTPPQAGPVTPAAAEPAPIQSEPTAPSAGPAPEAATPPASMPQPQPEEKCVTCGGPASGGTCSACGQGEISCTWQPASPTGGQGQPMGGPSSPSGEPGGNAPVV